MRYPIGAQGHGKYVVDILNKIENQSLKENIEGIGNYKNDVSNIVMLPSLSI